MQKRLLQIFFISLFVSISIGTKAQFSGVKWKISIFDTVPIPGHYPGFPNITEVIPSKNNEAFIVGQLVADIIAGPLIAAKVDSEGKLIWIQKIGFGGWHEKRLSKAKLTNDGGLVLVSITQDGVPTDSGYSDQEDYSNIGVYKISVNGELEWYKYLGGGRVDVATNINIDRNNDILISGYTFSAFHDFEGKRRFVDSAAYYDDSARLNYYTNYDAFIVKLSPTGQLKNVKCYGGSSSDVLEYIYDHPVYGYITFGRSDSKDYDLPLEGTKNGLWMLRLDTGLNIIDQKIIDTSIMAGSYFFEKDNKMYLSNPQQFRELGFDGSIVKDLDAKGVGFYSECYFDKSGYVYKPLADRKTIEIYDSLLNKVKSIKIDGWEHDFFQIYGANRNQLYITGQPKFLDIYIDQWLEGYEVQSNTVTSFSELYNVVQGQIYSDVNLNNIKDANESLINGLKIEARNNSYTMTVVSGTDGFYSLPLDSGHYSIQLSSSLPYYSVSPSSVQVQFPGFDKVDTIHFALQPNGSKNDLSINLLPLSIARPGFETRYRIVGYNKGTVAISNVQVKMLKDSRINFLSSVPAISTKIGDTLTWNIGTVQPLDSFSIDVHCRIAAPPVVNNADTLRHAAFILPVTGDETTLDNQVQVAENVQGSYDPNDKTETHGGIITLAQVTGNEYLTYLIRFQNTGTDTAFNVMIRDTLQNKLNWGSFEMIAASHPYQLYMIRPDVLEWSFPNILLPDSNMNGPASHGFIAYRIKPQSNLNVGDTVLNRAHIYFDYNLPVITNDAETIVQNQLVTAVVNSNRSANELLLYPNPANGQITVQWKGRITGAVSLRLYDALGKLLYQKEYGMQVSQPFNQVINTSDLLPGLYIITLQVGKDAHSVKLVVR
jgi:uncharacterized repeat protein (TIGR01451 family)